MAQIQPPFDAPRVTRLIKEGEAPERILPLFDPLIDMVISKASTFPRTGQVDAWELHKEDLAQEARLDILQVLQAGKYSPAKGAVMPFFWRVIHNHCATWLSRNEKADEIGVDPEDLAELSDHHRGGHQPDNTTHLVLCALERVAESLDLPAERLEEAARFILEAMGEPDWRPRHPATMKALRERFGLAVESSRALHDTVLVQVRLALAQEAPAWTGRHTYQQLLRLFAQASLAAFTPEVLPAPVLERFLVVFGGLTVTVPTLADLRRWQDEIDVAESLDKHRAGKLGREAAEGYARRRGFTWNHATQIQFRVAQLKNKRPDWADKVHAPVY